MVDTTDKTMEETLKYISFKVFCNNATYIKDYFYKLSKEEKNEFRKMLYGNTQMCEKQKDGIWEYIMGDIKKASLRMGRTV